MVRSLIPAERQERIREFLTEHTVVRIGQLSALLLASKATIRRDLEKMEIEGFLERTHGGAIINRRLLKEQQYLQRAQVHPHEKRVIGKTAAALIKDGDIVFINSGTTATQLIRQIHVDVDATIITNNLIAALDIGEINYQLIFVGGTFQSKSISVAGRFAVANLDQIYADKAFIGVDAISISHGCTVPTNEEAQVVIKMISRTNGPITIVADHSKWGTVSNFQIATIDQIHRLITDSGFSDAYKHSLISKSIDIQVAANS